MADNQNEGFIRQRRNLMVASLALLFSEVTELTVNKINIFGTEATIGQPYAITGALWVGTFYWLWRYYQYSSIYKGLLRVNVWNHVNSTFVRVAVKQLIHNQPALAKASAYGVACNTFEVYEQIPYEFIRARIELAKIGKDGKPLAHEKAGSGEVIVNGSALFWLCIKAWFHVVIKTTHFTDLILPYIVFTLPVLYLIYQCIT